MDNLARTVSVPETYVDALPLLWHPSASRGDRWESLFFGLLLEGDLLLVALYLQDNLLLDCEVVVVGIQLNKHKNEHSALGLARGDKRSALWQQPAQVIKGLAEENEAKNILVESINMPRAKQTHYMEGKKKTCLHPLTDYLLHPHRAVINTFPAL